MRAPGAVREPGVTRTPTRPRATRPPDHPRPDRPTTRDPTARPPATRPPGPAIDAALSWRASAARDPTARAVVVVVRTARDLCDRADALREHVT